MKDEVRVFIAVNPSESAIKKVKKLGDKLKREFNGLRLVKPHNLHLTLKFLGSIKNSKIESVSKIVDTASFDTAPFRIYLKSIGVFPDTRRPSVLWTGVEGDIDGLVEIEGKISHGLEEAGFSYDRRTFIPHLTIGRFKRGAKNRGILEKLSKFNSFISDEFVVDEIILFKSELSPNGARYTSLFRKKF